MKMTFYDVKSRKSVDADVTDKQTYKGRSGLRYAVKGKTSDGRNLTRFVSKADYDKA
jgi:hypothetical protein